MKLARLVRGAVLAAVGAWLLVPGAGTTGVASALVRATRGGVQTRFADPAAAVAAGYVPQPTDAPVVHFINESHASDTRPVDPAHPAGLVYARAQGRLRLVGAMFMLKTSGKAAPSVNGAASGWHTHAMCLGSGGEGIPVPGGACPPTTSQVVTPRMLHVWLLPVPGGPFAADMTPVALRCSIATKPAASSGQNGK